MKKFFPLAILLLLNTVAVMPAKSHPLLTDTGLVKEGALLKLVAKQFAFTEGASTDKYGNIFFTDQPNNTIWKYDTDGKLSVFMENTGRSNGTYFDGKGNLISCADERNQLVSISPSKKITVLVKDYNGHILNGPNDCWVNQNGAIYFTDPYYQRDYWTRKEPDASLGGCFLYYMKNEKTAPVLADSLLKQPNGIVGTPDGKYLYVADFGVGKTYRYDINKDGSLTNRSIFIEHASDGMTLDANGNLYITGNGVTVFNKDGVQIAHVDVPEKWTANICFGGKNKDLLFITASEAVYTLEMNVRGVE